MLRASACFVRGGGAMYCFAFVRLKPHAHMQNVLKRVNTIQHIGMIQRALARFDISDTEFIRWPWWGRKTIRHTPSTSVRRMVLHSCG